MLSPCSVFGGRLRRAAVIGSKSPMHPHSGGMTNRAAALPNCAAGAARLHFHIDVE